MDRRARLEARLAKDLTALRGPLEISIDYTILAQRLMITMQHRVETWEAAERGDVILLMRCQSCHATAMIRRTTYGGHDHIMLSLPSGSCTGATDSYLTDQEITAASHGRTNDAPDDE